MRYLGGKSRDAKKLAAVIDQYRRPGQAVWDPFCGGLSMAAALSANGPVLASDAHPALIALYMAVKAGWDPPSVIIAEQYAAAKTLPDSDPLKAFCGFGCSYSGKYWGGFARGKPGHGDYPNYARNSLLRHCPKVAAFACLDFLAVEPHPLDAVLYLDPPYAGTTGYATGRFDHALFVTRAWQWSQFCEVFVSEYQFPIGRCVLEVQTSSEKRLKQGAIERLYRVRG